MAGGAEAASDDQLTCEKCHGFYAVEAPKDGGKPRVRCNACGHTKDLTETPQQQPAGKWTVIGPDGKVMTFGSWDELEISQRPSTVNAIAGDASKDSAKDSAKESKKVSSASALLDITPTSTGPKLSLETDSDPNLGDVVAKAKKALEKEALKADPAAAKTAAVKTETPKAEAKKDDAKKDAPPDSIEELDPKSLIDDNSDAEPEPLSLRDAIIDDPDDEDDAHEMLSLKDLVVVPVSADDLEVDSTPPPPPRGALRTLPPTPSKRTGDAAPPPTISIEDGGGPPSKEAIAAEAAKLGMARAAGKVDKKTSERKIEAKKSGAGSEKEKETKKDARPLTKSEGAKAATKEKEAAKEKEGGKGDSRDGRKIASARAAVEEEPKPRGWVVPSLVVIAVSIVIWRVMIAPPSKTEPTTPTPPATTPVTAVSTPPTTPSADPSGVTSPMPTESSTNTTTTTTPPPIPSATTVASTTTTTTKPRHSGSAGTISDPPDKPEKKPTGEGLSMSEMLDRAGGAKRSGDLPTARDLYERILRSNPGNVEANGGLGDVARAQGDLPGAKASYERALAASPSYGPAQLGLADTEWDMGNRAGAQRRYAEIVSRLGDRAPERAKQRGTAPNE